MFGKLGLLFCLAGLLSLAGALPAASQARWLRAESPNFVIYTDVDRETAQRYADQLEVYDQVLRSRHGVAPDEPVRRKLPIYALRRQADLRRITPHISKDVKGFYRAVGDEVFAVAVAEQRGNDPRLQHEYAHHFMLQRYPFGYPAWLIEGYAEYFMTFRQTPKFLELGNFNSNRAEWLGNARWLPMERVLKGRPGDLRTSEEGAMFYAQSWALTHWMLSDPMRTQQLKRYLSLVGAGGAPDTTMTDATGLKPPAMERALRKYLSDGFPVRRFTLPGVGGGPAPVTELSPAAADLLLLSLRLKSDNGLDGPDDKTDGPVLLEEVRQAASRHPGEPTAELLLARAEVKLGDLGRAESLLQKRLAADPKSVEALQLLGAARLRAAEAASGPAARKLALEAGGFAARAHRLDPDSYQTLLIAARARSGSPSYPTQNDVNVLLDALDLAPQVQDIRMNAANALAARGDKAQAADILRPLAFSPHGGDAAAAARALLETLESGAAASGNPAAAGAPPAP